MAYHDRIEQNNNMVVDEDIPNNNISPKLSQKKALHLSKTTKNQTNMRPMQVNLISNICLQHSSDNHSNMTSSQGIAAQNEESIFINIPLSYNPNAPIDPEIWDGSFHPISFHSSIEHIASNAKNIKNSLKFMVKYISNKQVELSKVNNLDDFNGISNTVWNFISSIYNTKWNVLFMDNKSNTLRKKIAAKFTPRIQTAP